MFKFGKELFSALFGLDARVRALQVRAFQVVALRLINRQYSRGGATS